jgi:acyl-CoA thioester hydrolase
MSHELKIRVYYEDTDAGGIVFYANYLKFAERARTEYLRALGYENGALREREGLLFVVRRVEADYMSSARLDDILTVKTGVIEAKNASFAMKQSVFCGDNLLCDMTVWLVCVDLQVKPVRLPDDLKKALLKENNGASL